MMYVGLDLHKKFSYVVGTDEQGETKVQMRLEHHDGSVRDFFGSIKEPCKVAVEATSNWYWLVDELQSMGVEVVLSHPSKTRAIAEAKVKTDKVDATILAHLLRVDLLPRAHLPGADTRARREVLRHRAVLSRLRAGLKCKIHDVLGKHNIPVPFVDLFGVKGRQYMAVVSWSLPDPYPDLLARQMVVMQVLDREIDQLGERIEAMGEGLPDVALLQTMPGIGPLLALWIVSEIDGIGRFSNAKKLCRYAGLVPSTHQSADRSYHGRIIKEGDGWLKWTMVEAAIHAVRKDGYMKRFYERLQKTKGTGKARIAVARKLLKIVYWMLKEKQDYTTVLSRMEKDSKNSWRARAWGLAN